MKTRTIFIVFVYLFINNTATAQSTLHNTTQNIPGSLLGYPQSFSSFSYDPAGIGFIPNFRLGYYLNQQDKNNGQHLFGFIAPLGESLRLGLGGQYNEMSNDNSFGIFHLGLALQPSPVFSIGVSYHNYISRNNKALDNHKQIDIGLAIRMGRWAYISGKIATLNNAWLDNTIVPRQAVLSAGIRPFGNQYLLLGSQATFTEDIHFLDEPESPLQFFVHTQPIDGLFVTATTNHELDFIHIGLGLQFDAFYISGGSNLNNPKDSPELQGVVASVEFHHRPLKSLVTMSKGMKHIVINEYGIPLGESSTTEYKHGRFVSHLLYFAAQDQALQSITLHIPSLQIGLGGCQEIRNAIVAVQKTGKEVVVDLADAGDKEYYIASAASKITMSPLGWLKLNGLQTRLIYIKQTLSKLGISVDAVASGTYKTAPEFFTRQQPSKQALNMESDLFQQMSSIVTSAITHSRKIDVSQLQQFMKQGLFSAQEAIKLGLIDEINYDFDNPPDISFKADSSQLYHGPVNPADPWLPNKEIAVIPIHGSLISASESGFGNHITALSQAAMIEKAAQNPMIQAIVLDIDSPGGDINAAELLWRAVTMAKEYKPVYAAMRNVGTSGAYYVASAADKIIAQSSTLTGSIGVFYLLPNVSQLLDKLGVARHSIGDSNTDIFSTDTIRSKEQLHTIQEKLDEIYEKFIHRVASGRSMKKEQVLQLAQGKVYTGQKALEQHLIDELGGLWKALTMASKQTGIPLIPARLQWMTPPKTFSQTIQKALIGSLSLKTILGKQLPIPLSSTIFEAHMYQQPVMVLPFDIIID